MGPGAAVDALVAGVGSGGATEDEGEAPAAFGAVGAGGATDTTGVSPACAGTGFGTPGRITTAHTIPPPTASSARETSAMAPALLPPPWPLGMEKVGLAAFWAKVAAARTLIGAE